DVLGVCRQEAVRDAVVAGISVGGNVALQLALEHPESFKALVLVGCSSGPSDHGERTDGYMKQGVPQYHIKHLSALVSAEFSASARGKYLLSLFTDTDTRLV